MGMSTRVTAFASDKDETYKKHAKVLMACVEADILELPKETAEYFGSIYPEECLLEKKMEIKIEIHDWQDDMADGFEIYISEIPKGVYKIRFSNHW